MIWPIARSQMMTFKKTNYWSEIPDFLGNENYPDSAKAHIAYSGEEYQDWQNYAG